MVWIFHIISFVVASLPIWVCRSLCWGLAEFMWLVGVRKRTVLSNLSHAFPERSRSWQIAMGKRSLRRMLEMFLLAIALPRLSARRRNRLLDIPAPVFDQLSALAGKPTVLLTPHCTLMEGLVLLPTLFPEMPRTTVLFRPLDFNPANHWIKQSREKWGVRLLSRRAGIQELRESLAANEWVGILFDQNSPGMLSLFFGRVCRSTDLPAKLALHHGAEVALLIVKRIRFWEGRLALYTLSKAYNAEEITAASDYALETYLRSSNEACSEWFWAHKRWKAHLEPEHAFNLVSKRSCIAKALELANRITLPRTETYWIWLPTDPAQVRAILPWLQRVRISRPNAALIVCCAEQELEKWRSMELFDGWVNASTYDNWVHPIQERIAFPRDFPDACFVLNRSHSSFAAARRTGCHRCYGVNGWVRRGRFTATGPAPTDPTDSASWEPFFRRFGLEANSPAAHSIVTQ